jgi:hypothetical protein
VRDDHKNERSLAVKMTASKTHRKISSKALNCKENGFGQEREDKRPGGEGHRHHRHGE